MSIVGRLREGLRRTTERWTGRLERLTRSSAAGGSPGAETLEALEELLIEADVGVSTAARIVARIGDDGAGDLRARVRTEILDVLAGAAAPVAEVPGPRVVLVVGVNGTGKTTTVGKLAHRCRLAGETPLICAADTFRAAAVEQIAVWAERASVDIVRAGDGADPAAVVFDAISAARARGTRRRVGRYRRPTPYARRPDGRAGQDSPASPAARPPGRRTRCCWWSTPPWGQNGIAQARRFMETAGVTGIVLTKLDGTAKGGRRGGHRGRARRSHPLRRGSGRASTTCCRFSAEDYVAALFEKAW